MKEELKASKQSEQRLSHRMAEQQRREAAKDNERLQAAQDAKALRSELEAAQRKIREQADHIEQLHKYAINHRTSTDSATQNT